MVQNRSFIEILRHLTSCWIQYVLNDINPLKLVIIIIFYLSTKLLNWVFLSQEYNAKLSDFGLAKAGPQGDKTHVSTRVVGTYGYAAPEYVMTGKGVLIIDGV